MNQPLTILYDGRCNLCVATVDYLRGMEFEPPLKFVDMNDQDLPARYPQISREQLLGQMWMIAPDGSTSGGYDALVNLAALRSSMRPFVPIFRWALMRRLGWSLYRWVARNRYRLFGMRACGDGKCRIG